MTKRHCQIFSLFRGLFVFKSFSLPQRKRKKIPGTVLLIRKAMWNTWSMHTYFAGPKGQAANTGTWPLSVSSSDRCIQETQYAAWAWCGILELSPCGALSLTGSSFMNSVMWVKWIIWCERKELSCSVNEMNSAMWVKCIMWGGCRSRMV